MKRLLAVLFLILVSTAVSAQNADKKPAPPQTAEEVNTAYYICIHEAYAVGARSTADRTVLFKDIEKTCQSQRAAAYQVNVQNGAPPDKAKKNLQDFTNQIFVAADIEHSEVIGTMIKSITLFRGSTEFCDNAIKAKTQAKEQEYLGRLANYDSRFRDQATLKRIVDLYYDRRIRGMVEEHGAQKYCGVARNMIQTLHGRAADYFQ